MSSDAERFRFLADHRLTLTTAGDECRVQLVRKAARPTILPISVGATPDDAVDAAIARFELALDQRNHPRKDY
jgi:hypothetical protein